MAVQASGVDVFGAVGHWTEDLFHFEKSDTPSAASDVDHMQVDESSILPEIREAFDACGIPLRLAPKNMPEDMTVSAVSISESKVVCIVSIEIEIANPEPGTSYYAEVTVIAGDASGSDSRVVTAETVKAALNSHICTTKGPILPNRPLACVSKNYRFSTHWNPPW